ncbi:hypothetical protein Aduo_018838 [Ancylostoma duodenale]
MFQDTDDIDYCFFIDTLKSCVEKAETCEPTVNRICISETTKQLMQKRRELKCDGSHNVEFSILCKLIRGKVKEDVEQFKQERLLKAAEERKSTKKCRRDLLLYRNKLEVLKDKNGNTIESRKGMEAICKEVYSELLSSRCKVPLPALPQRNDRPPDVLVSEVQSAIEDWRTEKRPGKTESRRKY